MIKKIVPATVLLLLLSCTKEAGDPQDAVELVRITVSASVPQDEVSKTELQTDGKVYWSDEDRIAIYDGVAIREFTLSSGAGSETASFSGEIASTAEKIQSVYPFSAAYLENDRLEFTIGDQLIPSGQIADSDALVAKASETPVGTPLQFRNQVSLLKFTIDNGGDVYFYSNPADGSFCGGQKRGLKVTCPAAGTYCAAVVPGEYNGFNVFVGNNAKTTEKVLNAAANKIKNIGNVCDGTESVLIWNAADLNAYLGEPQTDGYIMDDIDASTGIIGATADLRGKFDGQGCSIRNWTANGTSLFTTNSAEIRNVVIDESCTLKYPTQIDGNFGFVVRSANAPVKGCVNNADIVSWTGNVTAGSTPSIAALIGYSNHSVIGCVNNGDITLNIDSVASSSIYVAAVTGRVPSGKELSGCENAGNLTINYTRISNKNNYIGGVCAVCNGTADVRDCINSGDVRLTTVNGGAAVTIGGVATYVGGGTIKDCTNSGDISYISDSGIKGTAAGGIAAYFPGSISGCANSGNVEISGTSFRGLNSIGNVNGTITASKAAVLVGGILGIGCPSAADSFKFNVRDCSNAGEVSLLFSKMDDSPVLDASGRHCVGGIVGDASGPVENCTNDGSVDVQMIASAAEYTAENAGYTAYIGGIVGSNTYSKVKKELDVISCTNNGDVHLRTDNKATVNHCLAGIVGDAGANSTENTRVTRNCRNTGTVTGEGKIQLRIAGIMAGTGRIISCTNEGAVVCKTEFNQANVGGIAGFHTSGMEIVGCKNTGKVSSTNAVYNSCCGGLVGLHGNSPTTTGEGCEIACDVEGPSASSKGIVIGGFNGITQKLVYGSSVNPIVVSGSVKNGGTKTTLTSSNFRQFLGGTLNPDEANHIFNARYVSDPEPQPKDKTLNGTAIAETSDLYGLISDSSTGKGIAGVPVTDGYKYVRTDANGVYQMTADSRCLCVTLSVPAEYDVPMNETTRTPAFYANDLDPVAFDRRDFTLTPITPKDRFTFAAVGDIHIGRNSGSTSSDWVKTGGERFRATTLADMCNHFVSEGYENVYACSVGDESNSNNLNQWPTIQAMTGNIMMSDGRYLPFFHCMGNHDHMGSCGETETDFYVNQRKRFISYCGPADYSVNIGKAHIVFLDNAAYNGATAYRLYDDTWKWLQDDLQQVTGKADKIVLLVYHCPFCEGVEQAGSKRFAEHRTDILNLLKQFHQAHMISGHTHRTEHWIHTAYKTADGTPVREHVLGMAGGTYWIMRNCPDGSPQAYTVFNIDGNEVSDYYCKTVGQPKEFQMRVYDGSAAINVPGSSGTYYWYNATSSMTKKGSESTYKVPGNANLKGSFVVNLWGGGTSDWTVELWKNGSKVGNLTRIDTITDVMNSAYTFANGEGNSDQTLTDTGHYYYIKAPGGNPATETGWTIKAIHKVAGSKGKTLVYECSQLTAGYDQFMW